MQTNNVGRGPLGVPTNSPVNDPGTSALIRNRPNVPIGTEPTSHTKPKSSARLGGNRELRTIQLPDLQIGTRGKHVERLQHLLKTQLGSNTDLNVDGVFDQKTRAAVIRFQKNSELNPDGVVGSRTWFALVTQESKDNDSGTKASGVPRSFSTALASANPNSPSATTSPTPAPPKEKSVDEWSLYERFEYVLLHTGSHLKGNVRDQFAALLTKTGLKYVVGALVVWGVSQFLGIGEIVDAALLLYAGFSAGHHLGTFILLTCSASTKKELDDAANNLAEAIEVLGVIAFFALLSRVARILRAKVNSAEEGGVAPKDEAPPAPETPQKPVSTEPTKPKVEAKGEGTTTPPKETAAPGEKEGVKPYETGNYKDLKARSKPGDGLDIDHQPSKAAQIKAQEEALGRKLTPAEKQEIINDGPCVAVPEGVHRAGPTYGGKNTAAQIAADSEDLPAAAARDSKAMIDNAAPADRAAAENAAKWINDQQKP